MAELFHTAERRKAKLRAAINGPSGSGKTKGALYIAGGLVGAHEDPERWRKVALIDTEAGSGDLYADMGPYAVATFEPPYRIERYVTYIEAAEKADYEVIIVDSLSHAWAGAGGLLEEHDRVTKQLMSQNRGNSYTAWGEITPQQRLLIDTMLTSPAHIVATMRTKDEYVLEANERGKVVPRKIGLAPVQRKDSDYEFTVVFDLARDHTATTSKDRTELFDTFTDKLSFAIGEQLLDWLNAGSKVAAARAPGEHVETPVEAPTAAGDGEITPDQVEALLAVIASKNRDPEGILRSLHTSRICEGGFETIPTAEFGRVMIKLAALTVQPEEPAAAPQEPSATTQAPEAPAAQEEATGAQDEGESPEDHEFLEATQRTTAESEKAPKATKRQLGEIRALIAKKDLPEGEWRGYMESVTGQTSRGALTKEEASAFIAFLSYETAELAV